MAIDFDINATVDALIGAIRAPARRGWNTISTFVTNQARLMAQQAATDA